MDDVTANAMSLARHERILARARAEREAAAAASKDFPKEIAAATAAAPAAAAPIVAISTPVAAIASPPIAPPAAAAVAEREDRPTPTLTTAQMDQLASAFAPSAGMPEDAPLDSRPQPVADMPLELSGDQAALLMSSFGVATPGAAAAAIPAGANAASGIPVASAAARSLVSDSDPSAAIAANLSGLPPDQQALLAASFGVNGAAALPAAAETRDEALLPVAPTPLSPPGAAAAAEPRFFPTSPNRSAAAAAAANASATDAYLRTLQTVNGRYGLDGANGR